MRTWGLRPGEVKSAPVFDGGEFDLALATTAAPWSWIPGHIRSRATLDHRNPKINHRIVCDVLIPEAEVAERLPASRVASHLHFTHRSNEIFLTVEDVLTEGMAPALVSAWVAPYGGFKHCAMPA